MKETLAIIPVKVALISLVSDVSLRALSNTDAIISRLSTRLLKPRLLTIAHNDPSVLDI